MKCKSPFIFKFKTKKFNYIYDVNTNEFLRVDDVIYDIIDFIYSFSSEEIISKFVHKYPKESIIQSIEKIKNIIKTEGVFLSTHPMNLKFYTPDAIEEKLRNELTALTLVVTEQCNLRCRYCVYSGMYHFERTHSSRKMSDKIALKAIDFFLNRCKNSRKVFISFYGGEPLLNFELIKKCVEYASVRSKQIDKSLEYSITTNGTLLHGEILDFLIKNKIGLVISLDGPKDIHDRYRTFPDGRGTFERIFQNLKVIKNREINYYRNYVIYNVTLVPPYNLFKIYEFFEHYKDLFGDGQILLINHINPLNTDFFAKNNINLDEELVSFAFQEKVLLTHFLNSLKQNEYKPALYSLFEEDFKSIHLRTLTPPFSEDFFMNHLCIPGQTKLLVDCEGKFYFCTNLSSTISIGDINSGFDFNRINQIIDKFLNVSQKDCCNCWAIRLCNACYFYAAKGEDFDIEQKRKICEVIRKRLERAIKIYNEVLEDHPKAFDSLVESKFDFQIKETML